MIPISYDERSTQEVLTNAIISPRSDDCKKLWMNIKKLKDLKVRDGDQVGYQYKQEPIREFPFLFKKVMVQQSLSIVK